MLDPGPQAASPGLSFWLSLDWSPMLASFSGNVPIPTDQIARKESSVLIAPAKVLMNLIGHGLICNYTSVVRRKP